MSMAEARAAEWQAGSSAACESRAARRATLRGQAWQEERVRTTGRGAHGQSEKRQGLSFQTTTAGSAVVAGAGKASWRGVSAGGEQLASAIEQRADAGRRARRVVRPGLGRRAGGSEEGGGGAPAASHLGPTGQGGGRERARWQGAARLRHGAGSEIAEVCAEGLVRLGRARPAGGCDQSGVEASHGRGGADAAVHGNSDFHAGLG